VEGAAANALRETPVPDEIKHERLDRFMKLAAKISAERLQRKVGRTLKVLIDRIDGDVAIARSSGDAPEIDGVVRIRGAQDRPTNGRATNGRAANGRTTPGRATNDRAADGLAVGDWAQVRITRAGAYDLEGKLDTRES
jgi:tRNA A37 methylthiotransferase MiaB